MDPRLQFNTSDLKELPMDWKFLSKVTDSFFVTMTFGKVAILSQQMCYPMFATISIEGGSVDKTIFNIVGNNSLLYHLPWWRHQPSPIFLMHSYHLPDKAGYCSMFIDLEAWHILHQRKRLLSAQGPTSPSLDRSHLLLFTFFTNIILPSGSHNQGNSQKNLQIKLGFCPKKVYLAV